jgi:hypothetical protein
MRATLAAICLSALALTSPARADFDDLATEYARIYATLGPAQFETDPDAQIAAARRMIASLDGTWILLNALARNGPEVATEHLDQGCSRGGQRLKPTGSLTFDLIRQSPTGPVTTRFAYIGFGQFNRYTDPAELST